MASIMLPYRVINECLWNRWLRRNSYRACSGRWSTFPLSTTYCLCEVMTSAATSPTEIRLTHSQFCEFVFLAPPDTRIRASLCFPEIETPSRNSSLSFGAVTRPKSICLLLKSQCLGLETWWKGSWVYWRVGNLRRWGGRCSTQKTILGNSGVGKHFYKEGEMDRKWVLMSLATSSSRARVSSFLFSFPLTTAYWSWLPGISCDSLIKHHSNW